MKALVPILVAAAAFALAGCGGTKTAATGGWIESCVHSDHPAERGPGGCGWLAPTGRFAYCHDYPDGIQAQLTCYSSTSGWEISIPHDDPPGAHPSARRVADDVGRATRALVMRPGETWYDSMPERTAEASCRSAKRFFLCELRNYEVWFKPDGTFALVRYDLEPNGYDVRYTMVERGGS
jgi:hypothetical protein